MWVLSLLVGMLVVLAITAATWAGLQAQEFAYMAVDRSRPVRAPRPATLRPVVRSRSRSARPRCQGAASASPPSPACRRVCRGAAWAWRVLGEALGGVGVPTGVGIAVGTVLALLFRRSCRWCSASLFPKNLAIAVPEPVAGRGRKARRLPLPVLGDNG